MSAPDIAPSSASLFVRALRREPVARAPVWVMRQAGRYLPEYRAVREKHGFLEMCRTPEIAALVSAQPIDRFGFDAAIIFSDILIPPLAMGARIDFQPGPVIEERVDTPAAVDRLHVVDVESELGFVPAAIRILGERLGPATPIIGFAGAPFTVAAYLIEGGGATSFERTKAFFYREPEAGHRLLDKLARVTAAYLDAQRRAGASALMLFDTHAASLGPDDFESLSAAYAERVFSALGGVVPRIYFAPGAAARLPRMARMSVEALGVDYRVSLTEARRAAGDGVALQGNLDPAVLLASRETVIERTRGMLRDARGCAGYVANLGHGITKETPIANVEAFVATVREAETMAGARRGESIEAATRAGGER